MSLQIIKKGKYHYVVRSVRVNGEPRKLVLAYLGEHSAIDKRFQFFNEKINRMRSELRSETKKLRRLGFSGKSQLTVNASARRCREIANQIRKWEERRKTLKEAKLRTLPIEREKLVRSMPYDPGRQRTLL